MWITIALLATVCSGGSVADAAGSGKLRSNREDRRASALDFDKNVDDLNTDLNNGLNFDLGTPSEYRYLEGKDAFCDDFCSEYNRPKIEVGDESIQSLVRDCLSRQAGCPAELVHVPLACWNTSMVTNMAGAFYDDKLFNGPLKCWDVSNVVNMDQMFYKSSFNQPIGDWDVSDVKSMREMFYIAKFNHPINNWDVSSVTDMGYMFSNGDFNQPIGDWDVSRVMNMDVVFLQSSFNQPIGDWDVSSVTTMHSMFVHTDFNHPIVDWNVSSVTDMRYMFKNADNFNQPIGDWDVSSVTDMESMFGASSFNQPIDDWDVSNVRSMSSMFKAASKFNKCLSTWGTKIGKLEDLESVFSGSGCPNKNNPEKNKPWCQMEEHGCTLPQTLPTSHPTTKPTTSLGSCANQESYTIQGKTTTCTELNGLRDKKRNQQCKKRATKKACPGTCNIRCTCNNKPTFTIKNNTENEFRGKYKCHHVGKNGQPTCDTKVNKKSFVKDFCPSKCDYCM